MPFLGGATRRGWNNPEQQKAYREYIKANPGSGGGGLFDDWYDYINPVRYVQKGAEVIGDLGKGNVYTNEEGKEVVEGVGGFTDLYEDIEDELSGEEERKKAEEEQAAAMKESEDSLERMFEKSLATQAPWLEAGGRGLAELEAGIGEGRFDVEPQEFQFDFEADPGYQFRVEQGQDIIESSRAARGGLFSGGTGRALQDYGQKMASQEYSKVHGREYGEFTDKFNRDRAVKTDDYNRLASLANVGQITSRDVAGQQMQQGGNLANLELQRGNLAAQGAMARRQGKMDMLNMGLQGLAMFTGG